MAEHWITFEPSPRWVRVRFSGETVADSRRMMLLRESGRTPVYYFPQADVHMPLLASSETRTQDAHKGEAVHWSVRVGDRIAEDAAWSFARPASGQEALAGYVAFNWRAMDHWYEEDDEVFVHARDPHKRVDALRSSRHVRVEVGGETVADSRRPLLLFETGLPTRYYLPTQDVRMDLLGPSPTVTQCPYKGMATYWTVRLGEQRFTDYAWSYQYPIPEIPKIEGLIAFYNERVDALYVDGELLARPHNRWTASGARR